MLKQNDYKEIGLHDVKKMIPLYAKSAKRIPEILTLCSFTTVNDCYLLKTLELLHP